MEMLAKRSDNLFLLAGLMFASHNQLHIYGYLNNVNSVTHLPNIALPL